jgi:hypothetical protein
MFLLIEVNSEFDVFEISKNNQLIDTLKKITKYEGIHFIYNGKVVCSIGFDFNEK